jgi:hypothetical protein
MYPACRLGQDSLILPCVELFFYFALKNLVLWARILYSWLFSRSWERPLDG